MSTSVPVICISLAMVLGFACMGCITPQGDGGATPSPSSATATTPSSPAPTQPGGRAVQVIGNVYGLSSDPLRGVDTIILTIGVPSQGTALDLSRMGITFSAATDSPVTLVQGTRESTTVFTTTIGGNAVTSLPPGEEAEVSFRVKAVPGGTGVKIEVRPAGGSAVTISRTVPAMIYPTNVLG